MGIFSNIFKRKENDLSVTDQKPEKSKVGIREKYAMSATERNDYYNNVKRQENKRNYLEGNPEKKLDNLLYDIKTKEKLGIYTTSIGEIVYDRTNYNRLSESTNKPEVLFMPYLSNLDQVNGLNIEDLPESVKKTYEEYKNNPEQHRKEYLTGFAYGVKMEIYNLKNGKFNKEEQNFIKNVLNDIRGIDFEFARNYPGAILESESEIISQYFK